MVCKVEWFYIYLGKERERWLLAHNFSSHLQLFSVWRCEVHTHELSIWLLASFLQSPLHLTYLSHPLECSCCQLYTMENFTLSLLLRSLSKQSILNSIIQCPCAVCSLIPGLGMIKGSECSTVVEWLFSLWKVLRSVISAAKIWK